MESNILTGYIGRAGDLMKNPALDAGVELQTIKFRLLKVVEDYKEPCEIRKQAALAAVSIIEHNCAISQPKTKATNSEPVIVTYRGHRVN
jgi:hypothetical protein